MILWPITTSNRHLTSDCLPCLAAYLEYHPATTLERHVLELAEQRILKQAAQSYMNFLREDEIQYLRNAWISSDAQEEANLL